MAELTRTDAERLHLAEHLRKMVGRGLAAAVALAVLSVIEYFIATGLDNPTWFLIPFMVAKGVVILQIFMHVSDVWNGGEH